MRGFIVILSLLACFNMFAQSLKHPVIWTTSDEKQKILELIETHDWAQDIENQWYNQIDPLVEVHQNNPETIVAKIPGFAENDHQNGESDAFPIAKEHQENLTLATNASILYYLTNNEKYAQFTADILAVYIDELHQRTPVNTTICGNAFYDPRTTYSAFAVSYDFIYNFLQKPGAKVYNKSAGQYVPFDQSKAQKTILNMVGNVLQEYGQPDKHGKIISNHPILTAPGALFGILCVEDDAERERLFKVFWETGTAHQNSFNHTILPMFSGQGIWPESLSYSFMPIITMVLNIVDRVKPEMEVAQKNQAIFEGNFLFDYLRNPDRTFVRYGDSKRYNDLTGPLYRYTLSIADRRGYKSLKEKAQVALQQSYEANGGYFPKMVDNGIFDNSKPLELFWAVPLPETIDKTIDLNKQTVIVEHAGIALQRNYVTENNEIYGLCGIIGGAHYVHSHLTGISMELYGAGYTMAPNAGLPASVPERLIPLHEHYFRLYAGNNTVVVNGTSHGRDEGSWKGKAHVWQNKTRNIAAEPGHLEDGISKNFSFATQFLEDTVNHALQERTLGIIRLNDTSAYYFDMFRSKANGHNNFHDYIYHNIGDTTQLTNLNNKVLPLKDTKRYQNDIGDAVKSPGWRYFEETKVTKPTSQVVKARFDINYDQKYMHLLMPNGVEREYTKALAPPTREAENGYLTKKTQVLVVRQEGEAWDRPFMAVLEPSTKEVSSVQNVAPLMDGKKTVGAIVTSKVDGALLTDYIICQDQENAFYINKDLDLAFTGRFAIARSEQINGKTKVTLYIGDGKLLRFNGKSIQSNEFKKATQTYLIN